MKFAAVLAAALLAVSPAAAWSFTWRDDNSHVADGTGNKGCTNISHQKDKVFEWDRGFFESCCIRLYSGPGCGDEVGISCPDWTKAASQNLGSFKVTDC